MEFMIQLEKEKKKKKEKGTENVCNPPSTSSSAKGKEPELMTCPDTRLLAHEVCYQHIFGTTTVIEKGPF